MPMEPLNVGDVVQHANGQIMRVAHVYGSGSRFTGVSGAFDAPIVRRLNGMEDGDTVCLWNDQNGLLFTGYFKRSTLTKVSSHKRRAS